MSKTNIVLIAILLILFVAILEINRDYMIGKVISVNSYGSSYSAIIEPQSSSLGHCTGTYQIHSTKPLYVNSIVKLKFKYSIFKDHTIKASTPGQIPQDYSIKIISQ